MTSVQSTSAISFAGRTPTCGPATCFGATSLTRPVRPEPPFGADGNVIFRYHLGAPNSEVILYRNFCRSARGRPAGARKIIVGCGGRILTFTSLNKITLRCLRPSITRPSSEARPTRTYAPPLDLNQYSSSNFDLRSKARDPQFPKGRLSIAKPTKQRKVN